MAFFDNLKIMTESFTKAATDMANSVSTIAREQGSINNIEKEIGVLNSEIDTAYTQIGRRFVEYVIEKKEMPGIDVSDILNMLEPKMSRKTELEAERIEIQKRLKDMALIQEKNRLEEEFRIEKDKLDRGRAMDIINEVEYEQKINQYRKKIDNFDEIKKIEQQYEFGIINLQEKEIKINLILNS
ncbi:MAG TPA: hypothetical protein VF839_13020 [Clostridium sp.]